MLCEMRHQFYITKQRIAEHWKASTKIMNAFLGKFQYQIRL